MTTTLTIILNHYLSNSLTEVQQKAAAPEMKELIDAIVLKHRASEIEVNPPATPDQIAIFERQIGFSLPADFKTFYTVCNGFQCNEELFFFDFIPLSGIVQDQKHFGPNWFYFAEYLVYADMWGMRLAGDGRYEIFNDAYPGLILTSSLHEYLSRFLQGNVLDAGGLDDWLDEIRAKLNNIN
jgi:hypothetical protein